MRPTPGRAIVTHMDCAPTRAARSIAIAGCFAVACALIASPAADAQPDRDDSIRVTVDQMRQLTIAKVELQPFRLEKAAVGQIAFNEDATTDVMTPFAGRVTRLIAQVGEVVRRGAPLLEIDSPDSMQPQSDLIAAIAALNKARAQHNLVQIAETRDKSLYEGQAGALKEWQQSRAALVAAQNDMWAAETAVAAARSRLRILGLSDDEITALQERGEIRRAIPILAPIEGVVITRKVRPGQYVRTDQSDALYAIADISTMWLKAFVPETDIPHIRIGQELDVRVTAVADRVFKARITYVGAVFEAATRRMMVRSEVVNDGALLKAEMFASFRIATGESATAPAVPIEAVIREGDVAAVFVEAEPRAFRRREVRLGIERDGRVQVRDGLKAGELVVARGAIFLDNQWHQ